MCTNRLWSFLRLLFDFPLFQPRQWYWWHNAIEWESILPLLTEVIRTHYNKIFYYKCGELEFLPCSCGEDDPLHVRFLQTKNRFQRDGAPINPPEILSVFFQNHKSYLSLFCVSLTSPSGVDPLFIGPLLLCIIVLILNMSHPINFSFTDVTPSILIIAFDNSISTHMYVADVPLATPSACTQFADASLFTPSSRQTLYFCAKFCRSLVALFLVTTIK